MQNYNKPTFASKLKKFFCLSTPQTELNKSANNVLKQSKRVKKANPKNTKPLDKMDKAIKKLDNAANEMGQKAITDLSNFNARFNALHR